MQELINNIPKAELHIHIEGSLEPELMFQLAQRNNVDLPYKSVEEVKKAYEFSDLQSFLDIYYAGANVLLTEQDFFDLAYAYFKRAHQDNICHSEIFFDPQTHTDRNIPFTTVIKGLIRAQEKAKQEFGITSHLIMCFLRHLSEDAAHQTLDQALAFKDNIIAVGLDSSERDHPPEKFQSVFQRAKESGFLTVAHAGEEGPAEYIWQAINLLNVQRIDHGVRSDEDEELLCYLAENQLPLTVCPLSNIKLRVYKDMVNHNIKKLLNAGLCVTINSDDPAYFGGYINDNFHACSHALELTAEDIINFAKNSFIASFLMPVEKQNYIDKIDKYVEENIKL